MNSKIIVGMSGGVDSSVAATLLVEEGYKVEGLFMKNWEEDDYPGFCAAAQDLADAQKVCDILAIPLHVVNFSKDYWERVFHHFLTEYQQGRTPNPDVLCNREIKFDAFLQHALTLGADFIATGHYSQIFYENNKWGLYKAKDRQKDQSYFLHAISPEVFDKIKFPIGHLLKQEVRTLAAQYNLPVHDKKDSTGICFIGEKNFKTFLQEFILAQPGAIKDCQGQLLGQHQGLSFYTIGQRQGLGIGSNTGSGKPWYVVDKEIDSNTLIVAQGEHPRLYVQGLLCDSMHWLGDFSNCLPLTCYAKTRYRQEDQACIVSPLLNPNQHSVMFANLQRAVTPGQYLVLYNKNQCLGGAAIHAVIR